MIPPQRAYAAIEIFCRLPINDPAGDRRFDAADDVYTVFKEVMGNGLDPAYAKQLVYLVALLLTSDDPPLLRQYAAAPFFPLTALKYCSSDWLRERPAPFVRLVKEAKIKCGEMRARIRQQLLDNGCTNTKKVGSTAWACLSAVEFKALYLTLSAQRPSSSANASAALHFHQQCVVPQLVAVPSGVWYGPLCDKEKGKDMQSSSSAPPSPSMLHNDEKEKHPKCQHLLVS